VRSSRHLFVDTDAAAGAPGGCPVCFASLQPAADGAGAGGAVAVSLRCGHVFCVDCLKRLEGAARRCPLCRRPFSAKHFAALHPDGDLALLAASDDQHSSGDAAFLVP
jgi:hypothetical protein